MARFLLLWLILADTCVVLAMAHEKSQNPNVAPSPSHAHEQGTARAPVIRKLGRHHSRLVRSAGAPAFSPSRAPGSEDKQYSTKEMGSSSDQTAAIEPKNEENKIVEGEKALVKKQHHSMDKSIAGGGVILGGLATTFLVAVFCYIRATGRKNSDSTADLT
ncbi:uncharacterized protein LOC117921222 [Vitis riparia]|uniref:uncharacterized protein LOC117921222 n=1 Tax=Vitis riparia TaxID=96939 RepID=UPI00155A58C8|nr:uncharacterized protein LOC117921222 [Vitis riparia]